MTTSETHHPKHYAHRSGIECWDIVERLSFNYGNIVKYLWRAGEKGQHQKDLRKALEYIERALANARAVDEPLVGVFVLQHRDDIHAVRSRCHDVYEAELELFANERNNPLIVAMGYLQRSKMGLRAASMLEALREAVENELMPGPF